MNTAREHALRSRGGSSVEVPDFVRDALRGSGRTLDASVRQDMEARFDHDFSRVRVYDDSAARSSVAMLGAAAYTIRNQIAFRRGTPRMDESRGRALLAHELTHVIQQERGGSRPAAGLDLPHEREASNAASTSASGAKSICVRMATGVGLDCAPDNEAIAIAWDLQDAATSADFRKRPGETNSQYGTRMHKLFQELVGSNVPGGVEGRVITEIVVNGEGILVNFGGGPQDATKYVKDTGDPEVYTVDAALLKAGYTAKETLIGRSVKEIMFLYMDFKTTDTALKARQRRGAARDGVPLTKLTHEGDLVEEMLNWVHQDQAKELTKGLQSGETFLAPGPSGHGSAKANAMFFAGQALLVKQFANLQADQVAKAEARLEELGPEIENLRSTGKGVTVTLIVEVPNLPDPFIPLSGFGGVNDIVVYKTMYISNITPATGSRVMSSGPTMSAASGSPDPLVADAMDMTLTQQLDAQLKVKYPVREMRPTPGHHYKYGNLQLPAYGKTGEKSLSFSSGEDLGPARDSQERREGSSQLKGIAGTYRPKFEALFGGGAWVIPRIMLRQLHVEQNSDGRVVPRMWLSGKPYSFDPYEYGPTGVRGRFAIGEGLPPASEWITSNIWYEREGLILEMAKGLDSSLNIVWDALVSWHKV